LWYVVGPGDAFVSTTQVVIDHAAAVIYLKLPRVPAVWNTRSLDFKYEIAPGEEVYIMSFGSTESGTVVSTGLANMLVDQVLVPKLPLKIANSRSASGFVFSSAGALLGVYNQSGFIPASYFSDSLPHIFLGKQVPDIHLGVAGWWGSEHPIFSNNRRISGFYVAQVTRPRSLFKVGDVIEKIDTQVVGEKAAWYTIPTSSFNVTVFRDGSERLLVIPQSILNQSF
jgi:hypothetical protein